MSPEMSANRLNFCNPAGITIEYSRDGGGTWTDYGATDEEKTNFVSDTNTEVHKFLVGKPDAGASDMTNQYQLRVTINAYTAGFMISTRKLLLYVSTDGSESCKCDIDIAHINGTSTGKDYTRIASADLNGWPGWNCIDLGKYTLGDFENTNTGYYGFLRITCRLGGFAYGYPKPNMILNVIKIKLFGETAWIAPSTLAKQGVNYTVDAQQNTTFPAAVKATRFGDIDLNCSDKFINTWKSILGGGN